MQNMQNMQNISPLFFWSKDQKSKISESESLINSRTCLGHLVLFLLEYEFIVNKARKRNIISLSILVCLIPISHVCFLRRVQNKQSWRLIYQQSKFYFQRFFFPKPKRSRPSLCQDAKLYFTPFWKRGGQDQSNSRREQVWRWLGAAAGLTWIWDGCTLRPTHDLNTIEQHIKNTQIKFKANSQTQSNRLRPPDLLSLPEECSSIHTFA